MVAHLAVQNRATHLHFVLDHRMIVRADVNWGLLEMAHTVQVKIKRGHKPRQIL